MQKGLSEIGPMERPHLIILGAGASRACCPNGDYNGKKLPLMNDLLECTGVDSLLKKYKYKKDEISNFEVFFSKLKKDTKKENITRLIEDTIYKYFSEIKKSQGLTIYHYLLLCLRKKDCIATFNWDPLLVQSMSEVLNDRNQDELPKVLYLHGNVAIGTCQEHHKYGNIGKACSICKNTFNKLDLLYPVTEKKYNENPLIKEFWDILREVMSTAYYITIFGYSAPQNDIEAKSILLKALNDNSLQTLAQLEIIDIRPREEITKSWSDFIKTMRNHYHIISDFLDSDIVRYPRRSCEALWKSTMENSPIEEYKVPKLDNLYDLYSYLEPLMNDEDNL